MPFVEARRHEAQPSSFTGGVISGNSKTGGDGETSSLLATPPDGGTGSTALQFTSTGDANAFVDTMSGMARGNADSAVAGNTATTLQTTGAVTTTGTPNQASAVATNAGAVFNGGFSPAEIVGQTTVGTTPVILIAPSGLTGGTASVTGNVAGTSALEALGANPAGSLIFGASSAGATDANSDISTSSFVGSTASDASGNTTGNAISSLTFQPGISIANTNAGFGGAFEVATEGVFGTPTKTGSFDLVGPIAPFTLIPAGGNRNLKESRKTQDTALISGGIVSGASAVSGGSNSYGFELTGVDVLIGSSSDIVSNGSGSSSVKTLYGTADGETEAASNGKTAVSATGPASSTGQAAGNNSDAAGAFCGGFSPNNGYGSAVITTVTPFDSSFTPTILLSKANGVTGSVAAANGGAVGYTALTQNFLDDFDSRQYRQ
jgi:hypothetical protein